MPVALDMRTANMPGPLARSAATKQPSMVQMIARLTRDGLMDAKADPDDGRVARLALTYRARRHMPESVAALFAGNEEAMASLGRDEVAVLVAMLQRIVANLAAMTWGGVPDGLDGCLAHAGPGA